MNQAFRGCYLFGEFRLDGAERRLLRNEAPISLPPKILDTLLLLVENAGHLVEKDEFMKRLWPDTFVGEDALARNISILRKALGGSSDSQSCIATVPTRGYRFVASVQVVSESEPRVAEKQPSKETDFAGEAAAAKEEAKLQGQQQERAATIGSGVAVSHEPPAPRAWASLRSWPRWLALAALVLGVGSVAGLGTFFLLSPVPIPRVIRTVQLTHSGRTDPWTHLVTDGSRIYFNERAGDHWNLVQTSVAGGESQTVDAPFRNTAVLAISPDHANLLIGTFERRFSLMPLWIWPAQGGAPRRVGDITAYEAAWSPNGRELIFGKDDGAYITNIDGTNLRKFVPWEGRTGAFSWSPDGRFLRFEAQMPGTNASGLWEVLSDGSSLRRLIPGWNSPPDEWNGTWDSRGQYFLFESHHSGSLDIWALAEHQSWIHRLPAEPVRLTAGPTDFFNPLVSADGHKVFVYGAGHGKTDWVRFDLHSRQFLPVLPGVPLSTVSFSRDGEWLAYVSSPDYSLIRMRPDGTQRLVLAPPSFHPWLVCWSPDGKQIVFTGETSDGVVTLFVVARDGGAPGMLLPEGGGGSESDPAWSPDGKDLVFNRERKPASANEPSLSLFLFHVSTKLISPLPGSQGFGAASWSPDGRFIAAKSEDQHSLAVYDNRTQKWSQLATANYVYDRPWWSSDGKCLYYQDLLAPGEPIYCLHWPSKKREVAVSFEQLLRAGANKAAFIGLGPDGSLLAALERSNSDIYALDVDFP